MYGGDPKIFGKYLAPKFFKKFYRPKFSKKILPANFSENSPIKKGVELVHSLFFP